MLLTIIFPIFLNQYFKNLRYQFDSNVHSQPSVGGQSVLAVCVTAFP